ncbi:MAG: type II secretion system protein GspG [Candidatus Hydrogenedentes bacterium]|nr:type II secretion system protein GspG [Candidatus Hydrogenedentota bacterium]
MRTAKSRRRRNGCILTAFFGGFAAISLVLGYIIIAISTPPGSPKAEMYRTESALTALVTAVNTYKADLGMYPPAGQDGLVRAMRHLSKTANYMPQTEALDSWGNPFIYAPSDSYASTNSGAMRDDNAYYAPDTYQLYSVGMDGDAGANSIYKQMDNITNWDGEKPWRETYHRRHQEFFLKRGTVQ